MTTGTLLPTPVFRAVDSSGAPMAGALLQFYQTGATTPTPVYTTSALSTALSNPVVADGGGLFPAIYMDPGVTYRVQLQTSGGSVVADIDPVNVSVPAATTAQVNAGTATGVYVSPATLSAWTGVAAALGFTPVNKAGDTATNLALSVTAPAATSAGYLGTPINEQDAAYTFALTDAGKMVRGNNASAMAYTIPPNSSVAFPIGAAIVVRNAGAGTITLTRGSGVTNYGAGGTTNKDWALAGGGLATLIQEAANVWVVSGTGLS